MPALSGPTLPSASNEICQQNLSLRGESKTRAALGLVEDGVDGLEEDVAKDAELNAVVGLDASEALGAAGRGVVDVAAGDGEGLAVDCDVEVGELGGAREDVATLVVVVRCAGDGRVVVVDGLVGEEKEGGASVGDGGANRAGSGRRSDAVTAGVELPESVTAVDWGVGDGAGVLGGVDEAEVV